MPIYVLFSLVLSSFSVWYNFRCCIFSERCYNCCLPFGFAALFGVSETASYVTWVFSVTSAFCFKWCVLSLWVGWARLRKPLSLWDWSVRDFFYGVIVTTEISRFHWAFLQLQFLLEKLIFSVILFYLFLFRRLLGHHVKINTQNYVGFFYEVHPEQTQIHFACVSQTWGSGFRTL